MTKVLTEDAADILASPVLTEVAFALGGKAIGGRVGCGYLVVPGRGDPAAAFV